MHILPSLGLIRRQGLLAPRPGHLPRLLFAGLEPVEGALQALAEVAEADHAALERGERSADELRWTRRPSGLVSRW